MASQYDGGCRRGMTPQGDSGERVTWALRLEIREGREEVVPGRRNCVQEGRPWQEQME